MCQKPKIPKFSDNILINCFPASSFVFRALIFQRQRLPWRPALCENWQTAGFLTC